MPKTKSQNLIPCKDCGAMVSHTATRCPKCGRQRKPPFGLVIAVLVAAMVALLFIAPISKFIGSFINQRIQRDFQDLKEVGRQK